MNTVRMRRILFATDFLESSRLALDYAVALAHHFGATLLLLHAIELPSSAEAAEGLTRQPSASRKLAQERLDAFASGVRRNGLTVDTLVEDGTPCEVILRTVETQAPDLLVLGVHGEHRGVDHLVIGSNTEKILLTVRCPTLSVGAHVRAGVDQELRLKEILYCSDLTPAGSAAARYALFLGKQFHVPVQICHLAPRRSASDEASFEKITKDYCNALRTSIGDAADEWCTPEFHLEHCMGFDEILKRAESEFAGLIVLGVHTESQLGRHIHTSLAYKLLTRATCPVLSVRAGPGDG